MPAYFLDSSGVVKYYHPESGSERTSHILTEPDATHFISRPAVVEVQRAFVGKARTRHISIAELDELCQGFLEAIMDRTACVVSGQ